MRSTIHIDFGTVKGPVYRVLSSYYWATYWYSRQVVAIASIQIIATFGIIFMEVGNTVVDVFRSNVYSGFWSAPFMVVAILTTYACVCATRTQNKAIIALICQLISMIVMLIVVGFLFAFIGTNFTLCLGFQCSQSSSTSFSSSEYLTLKQAFISCQLVCSIINILLSILYIYYFIKCYKRLPRIPSIMRTERPITQIITGTRQLSTMSKSSRALSTISKQSEKLTTPKISSNRSDVSEYHHHHRHHHHHHHQQQQQQHEKPSAASRIQSTAQKVCPECKHVSPYIPDGNFLQCPNCGYKSLLVEHAQQW